jgi:transposase-like protein
VDRVSAVPRCPFCDAADAERVGQWGGQIITSQWRCGVCGSYFEALREDFADDAEPPDLDLRRPPGPGVGAFGA